MDELYSIHRDGQVSGPNRLPRRPTRKAAPVMVDDPLAGVGVIGTIEAAPANPTEPPPSDRQRIYIADLCAERGLAIPDVKTRSQASDLITKLKSTPRFPQGVVIEYVEVEDNSLDHEDDTRGYYALRLAAEGGTLIPCGRYALENAPTNTENDISFWSVWVNDAGTVWRLKQVVGPNLENVSQQAILPILRRIGDDPEAAMALYGHEIGQCGACNRRLTNELSRRLGIGPICRSMRGWSE
jgi:Family of unknown function (DUF6011)